MTVFFKSHSEAWQHLRFDITWRGTLFITETFISINLFRHLCELPLDRIMTDSLYTSMYFLSTFFIFYLYRFVQKAFPYFPCYQNRIFLNAKKKKMFLFLDIFCVPFSRKSECHERCLSWLAEKASDLEALDKNIVRSISEFCVRSEDKYVYGNSRKRFSGDENVFFRFIVGLTEDNQNECDFC